MLIRHNPKTMPPSFSAYSQAVEVPPAARWLHISGQVGAHPDGTLAAGSAAQIELTWRNVLGLLTAAGMGPQDLVKVNGYIVRPEDTGLYRDIRDSLIDGAEPASTLVIVPALAHPDWLVEIEAVAAAM